MAIDFKPLDKATFNRFRNRTQRPETADYWIDRAFKAEESADKTQAELLRDMAKVYRKSLAELEKEIQAFYGRYATENGLDMAEVHKRLDPKQLKSAIEEIHRYYEFADPKKIGRNMSREYRDELRRLSARAYMSRLEEIKARMKHIVIKLAAEEKAAYEEALKKVYSESHAQTAYTIDKGLGFSEGYSAPNDETLTKVVSEKWLDSNYSDRIWLDKGKLLTAIENELLSGIAQGHNPRKIAAAMSDRYNLDYKNCERLARTETIHAMNSATYDSYKEHGIEKYQFVCGLDERTCPDCGALDGSVHEMKYKQEGINYPVMHPNCYSEDTEVLTKDGWKKIKKCGFSDAFYSINPESKETIFMNPISVISGESYSLVRFVGNGIDIAVTDTHDMLVGSENGFYFEKAINLLFLKKKGKTDLFFLDNDERKIFLSDIEIDIVLANTKVYCVELPIWHTLLVRRNGSTPVWCGNCRCTTVPYFDDEISKLFDDSETTRLAYDEERNHYDVPANMTYRQWREMVTEKKE